MTDPISSSRANGFTGYQVADATETGKATAGGKATGAGKSANGGIEPKGDGMDPSDLNSQNWQRYAASTAAPNAQTPSPGVSVEPGATGQDDAQAAKILSDVDKGLEQFPGSVGSLVRDQVKDAVRDLLNKARENKVDISTLKFDLNLSGCAGIANGSLSVTIFPPAEAGKARLALGVNAPTAPGAWVSVGHSTKASEGLTGDNLVITSKVATGTDGIMIRGDTSGRFGSEKRLIRIGSSPNASISLSTPFSNVTKFLDDVNYALLSPRAREIKDSHYAMQQTTAAMQESYGRFVQQQRAMNGKYDQLIAAEPSPGMKTALDQERGKKLHDLQDNLLSEQALIQQGYEKMMAAIKQKK
jgi:hypothetical protein